MGVAFVLIAYIAISQLRRAQSTEQVIVIKTGHSPVRKSCWKLIGCKFSLKTTTYLAAALPQELDNHSMVTVQDEICNA